MKYKAVLIEWADSCTTGDHAWKNITELDHKPVTIQSVGYIIGETRLAITIAAHISQSSRVSGDITIPKACIFRRKSIKLP